MLRIGKLTDYAILIMRQMAKDQSSVLSATVLAESLHLTLPTVSKILKMLADAQLVNSVRGAEGGYHLARPAEKITLVDIISAMEGEFAITECCDSNLLCVIDAKCTLRENWKKINKLIQRLLTKITIVDMLQPLSLEILLAGLHEK